MFSDHLVKVSKLPSGLFMAVAAGLAFVSLLAALVHVVNGQVEQGLVRQAQYKAAQVAIAGCAASYSGTVRRQCIEQVHAGFAPYSTYTPETELQASIKNSAAGPAVQADASALPGGQGFLQAAFAR